MFTIYQAQWIHVFHSSGGHQYSRNLLQGRMEISCRLHFVGNGGGVKKVKGFLNYIRSIPDCHPVGIFKALLRVMYRNYRLRGGVKWKIQHKAKPRSVFDMRPHPKYFFPDITSKQYFN